MYRGRRAAAPRSMKLSELPRRTPFFYGWIILACAMCASFARQAAAVATLSVFVVPMTVEFDWSRSQMSGAVALGGVLAALVSPMLGRLVDRSGARTLLVVSTIAIASVAFALSATASLLWFYVFFAIGRMIFASPFDIGTSAAVANWFRRKRSRAMSYLALGSGASLAVMPMMAGFVIAASDWRMAWIAVGLAALIVGAVPNGLLMVRRPEDVGLRPDGDAAAGPGSAGDAHGGEVQFAPGEAARTPALWLLMLYMALIYSVQAGMSLHQAPHMIERGLSPTAAASVVATFSLLAATGSFVFGWIGARLAVRHALALAAAIIAAGAWLTYEVDSSADAYLAAIVFGAGIGGLLTMTPVAFADYFGRASFGAIRGIALPVQIAGQASGPLIAGVLRDQHGSYHVALATFFLMACAAAVVALFAHPPRAPARLRMPAG
jgi:MFS family permease